MTEISTSGPAAEPTTQKLEHVVTSTTPKPEPEVHHEEKTVEKSTEHVPAKEVQHETTTVKKD